MHFIPNRYASGHMDQMYKFWSSLLLDKKTYKGNPMLKHIPIRDTFDLSTDHFEQWLLLWTKTIDELYSGAVADVAIQRAKNIAQHFMKTLRIN